MVPGNTTGGTHSRIRKLALQEDGYLRWIVDNFKTNKEWHWVDLAKALLLDRNSQIYHEDGASAAQLEISVDQLDRCEPNSATYALLLRRCTEARALLAGKRVHAHIVENGYARNSYMENLLVHMYGKCRKVDHARLVFDAMLRKDLFSWNIMISAYAQNGYCREALGVFNQMASKGIEPDVYIFASILGVYAKCKSLEDARKVFDRMRVRDAATWTAMISAYAQQGHGKEALELFRKMDLEGMEPNALTFVSILGACTSLGCLAEGKAIHARFTLQGFQLDAVTGTALLNLYAKCGTLEDAKTVFDGMHQHHRDVPSWTSMIEAYTRHGHGEEATGLYRMMNLEGMEPDIITLVAALGACSLSGALVDGNAIHAHIETTGMPINIVVETALLNMYGKCGNLDHAQKVFDKIQRKDVVAWNAMIAAYVQHEQFPQALKLYSRMEPEGVLPDIITFGTILGACSSSEALEDGKAIHARFLASGFKPDINMQNALLNMYAKCGSIEDARSVFDKMPERNVVTWNAIIAWYVRYGIPREALDLYQRMVQSQGLQPDVVTYVGVLAACSSLGALAEGKAIHARVDAGNFKPDVVLETTLVNMYAKCGGMADARRVFEEMLIKNVVSFNAMLAAYAQHGHVQETVELYRRMVFEGLDADVITLLCILVAFSHAGLPLDARNHFVSLRGDHEIVPIVDHYHCLIDLLSRAGRLQEAEDVLNNMPFQPGAVGWKSLLGACAVHGDAERGARAAGNACKLDPSDSSQYVLLSNIYSSFGMHKDAEKVRKTIKAMGKALECNILGT